MHHHEPECCAKRLVHYFQGQGHSKSSYDQNMTVFSISFELLILLLPNLLWWHIIISLIVLWKDWIALLWSKSRSEVKFRIPVNVHLDDILSTAEPFVTKFGIVMHHHGPEYHARRLVCCLQFHSITEGSYNQMWLCLPYLLNCWYFGN